MPMCLNLVFTRSGLNAILGRLYQNVDIINPILPHRCTTSIKGPFSSALYRTQDLFLCTTDEVEGALQLTCLSYYSAVKFKLSVVSHSMFATLKHCVGLLECNHICNKPGALSNESHRYESLLRRRAAGAMPISYHEHFIRGS